MTQQSLDIDVPVDPDKIEIEVNALIARQPIGDVILAKFPFRDIIRIAYFDVRRLVQDERDLERYLGIQRPLIRQRVDDLQKYVNFADATFPTAIIVAVEEEYASYDEDKLKLRIRNFREGEEIPSTNIRRVARVIDGQHRIAGLMAFRPEDENAVFDVPVTVFIGADIADQAFVFSTVNLEQTKVSRSLAIDLYELARTRSPVKTCHNIAVALDRDVGGPLYQRIKRLGFATEGREFEPITQANFVDTLVPYISGDPKMDRDLLLRGKTLQRVTGSDEERRPFRNMFIDGKDLEIARIVSEFFYAVRERWPIAWDSRERGWMLNRTNGIRALLRALRSYYLRITPPGGVVTRSQFLTLLKEVEVDDRQLTTEFFPPGTSGESKLYRILIGEDVLQRPAPAA